MSSVSSASTRQDSSVSGTRNGGWYSNAVKMGEPEFCFWCTNQIPAETPTTATTLRMTRVESSALGSKENNEGKAPTVNTVKWEYSKKQWKFQRQTYSFLVDLPLKNKENRFSFQENICCVDDKRSVKNQYIQTAVLCAKLINAAIYRDDTSQRNNNRKFKVWFTLVLARLLNNRNFLLETFNRN